MQWVLSAWNFDPWVIGGLLGAVTLYARGVATVWRRAGVGAVVSPARVVAFAAGAYVLALAVVSPLDTMAHLLFSAHMVQHAALMLIAAPLLVAGAPLLPFLWGLPRGWRVALGRGWSARPGLGRVWHALTGPVVVWCVLAATLGALLTFVPRPMYPVYEAAAAGFGLTPLQDQYLAGLIMGTVGGLVYLVAGTLQFLAWLRGMERRARPPGASASAPPLWGPPLELDRHGPVARPGTSP